MGSSNQIVIRPDDLHTVARRLGIDADRFRAVVRGIDSSTAAVRLNGRDPGLSPAAFGAVRLDVGRRLRSAADAMDVDADLLVRTGDEALAGDVVGSADRIDELSERIRSWDGSDNDPRFDRLVRQRNDLIDAMTEAVFGGGSSAAVRRRSGGGPRAVDR